MEGGGFLCSEKDYAMENPRIWKDVERKELGYWNPRGWDSFCSMCLKVCLGCCSWAVSNKAGGVMALKHFSSLGWKNRVLFLRARLQVKPEFPRRGASRWSGIVLGQESVLSRVDMILATGVPASHKPWRLFHQITTWSRSLSPWNFSFCIFCFLFLSKDSYSSFCSFILHRVIISVCPRNADRSKFAIFMSLVF